MPQQNFTNCADMRSGGKKKKKDREEETNKVSCSMLACQNKKDSLHAYLTKPEANAAKHCFSVTS